MRGLRPLTARPLPTLLVLAAGLATLALPFLLWHRSGSAIVLGHYSGAYATLLALYAFNLWLFWRRTLPRLSPPGDGSAAILLAAVAVVFSAAWIVDLLLGATPLDPSQRVVVALACGVLVQLVPGSRLWGWAPGMRSPKVVLGAILLAALLLRAEGIGFGLPFLYEADEHVFVNIAGRMLQDHDPNPHWFGHPGTTTIYSLSVLCALIYGATMILGRTPPAGDFATFFAHYPTAIYLSGRWMVVVFGLATIVLTYWIARRLFNPATGLMAASLLALSPLHTWYSRVIRTDVQATMIILLVFALCLDLLGRRRRSTYALAGFFTGVGTATKYTAVIVAGTLVFAHLLTARRQWRTHARLLLCGAAALLGLFAASPFLLIDLETALADLSGEAAPVNPSGHGQGFGLNLLWYLRSPLPEALSGAGLLLALAGSALCLTSRRREWWLLVSFPVFYLIAIASLAVRWSRWCVPVTPFLCILAAHALHQAAMRVGQRWNPRLAPWTGLVLLAAVGASLAGANIAQGRALSRLQTRTLAASWILDHIPAGSRILVETQTPQLPAARYRLFVVNWDGVIVEAATERSNDELGKSNNWSLAGSQFIPYGHIGMLADREAIRRHGIEYMVTGSTYHRYLAAGEVGPDQSQEIAGYDAVTAAATQLYEIGPDRERVAGPRVRVYRFDR